MRAAGLNVGSGLHGSLLSLKSFRLVLIFMGPRFPSLLVYSTRLIDSPMNIGPEPCLAGLVSGPSRFVVSRFARFRQGLYSIAIRAGREAGMCDGILLLVLFAGAGGRASLHFQAGKLIGGGLFRLSRPHCVLSSFL